MRIDKFLTVTRIIKRRTISKDIINFEKVKLNNKTAKPSSIVKVGDFLDMDLGHRKITIKILAIIERPSKEQSLNMYEIINEEAKCSNNLL